MYNFSHDPKQAKVEGKRDRLNGYEPDCSYVGTRKKLYKEGWEEKHDEILDLYPVLQDKVNISARGEMSLNVGVTPSELSKLEETFNNEIPFCSGCLVRAIIIGIETHTSADVKNYRCKVDFHGVPKVFLRNQSKPYDL